jgi:hypothetical protein
MRRRPLIAFNLLSGLHQEKGPNKAKLFDSEPTREKVCVPALGLKSGERVLNPRERFIFR